MPKADANTPPHLKPYLFHGIQLETREGADEANGDCPWCGKENKLYVSVKDGLWQCKSCIAGTDKGGGNVYTFLRMLWGRSMEKTSDYSWLLNHRKLLRADTLTSWGVCKSYTTNEWLVPGYSPEGKLTQLYRYCKESKTGKYRLFATPELHHAIHGRDLWDQSKPDVYVCEGPWDGMALWETMRQLKRQDDGGLVRTASDAVSLAGPANILAVPGANVFPDAWSSLLKGKNVTLMFDSDHEREHEGRKIEGAGFAGARRVAQTLGRAEEQPKLIQYLNWGPKGYDPDLPSGHDVRDFITTDGPTIVQRATNLEVLLSKITPIPADWISGRTKAARKAGATDMDLIPCDSFTDLQNQWRKAMKWTEGLDRALSVMLASVSSTKAVGDQLWVKVIGPAACGKSTLCEALSSNKQYVLAKSTIRGFHSGFQTDKEGSEDNSLLAQLNDKTLVTKDGDTLLQSPNLPQILSEARDIYDRTSRTHYRNKMGKDYEGVNMTWLLCGTSSLRSIDSSELGERFLDCVIMESIDEDLEDEILWRVANRVQRNMGLESGKDGASQNDPDMTKAMQLTGGYVSYLRSVASQALTELVFPETLLKECIQLGKFVAYMRARPSLRQAETAEREFATRLVSQLIRLASCLSVVMNVEEVNLEVMRRTRQVALDTARGRVLEIVGHIYRSGVDGVEARSLLLMSNESEKELPTLLRFLRRIEVLEVFTKQTVPGIKGKPRWRLTTRLRDLYQKVMGV